MAGTLEDFIGQFTGALSSNHTNGANNGAANPDLSQYIDRFASNDPEDAQFDNQQLYHGATEYLSQMPDDSFLQAAMQAFSQSDNTQRQGLAGGLLNALGNNGLNLQHIAGMLGLSSFDPHQMNGMDYARLANYARQYPNVMQAIVQQQPWFLKALGNPIVTSILGTVASRMMQRR